MSESRKISDSPAAAVPAWLIELHNLDPAEIANIAGSRLAESAGEIAMYSYELARGQCRKLRGPVNYPDILPAFDYDPLTAVRPILDADSTLDCVILADNCGPNGLLLVDRNAQVDGVILGVLGAALGNALRYQACRAEARLDCMTGLYNARWVQEALAAEVGRAERYGKHLALLMIDVDGLKPLNDTYGHSAGNRALRHVADQIRFVLRRADSAARIGGDEFVAILPEATPEGARRVAERLKAVLAEQALLIDGHPVKIGASIGVAHMRAGTCAEDLLAAADRAMYVVKRARRGRSLRALLG